LDPAPSFERYSVVAFAPGWIVEDLRKVRARAAKSGVPIMDAHVTVKGGFTNPKSLASVEQAIEECVRGYPPFTVRTTEPVVDEHGGTASVLLPLEESRQLDELHERILGALRPLADGHTYPGDQPGRYRPHVTVVQQIPTSGVEQTLKAIIGWRVNYFWTIRDVDLVGLDGGRLWRSAVRFDFGKPVRAQI
jgi:2'-5' RNA ligase